MKTLVRMPTPRAYKPLAAASQHLRQLERERKLVAKLPANVPPFPPLSNGEVAAARKQSQDERTKRIEYIYNQVSGIALNGTAVELDQLSAVLKLYELRIAQRNQGVRYGEMGERATPSRGKPSRGRLPSRPLATGAMDATVEPGAEMCGPVGRG